MLKERVILSAAKDLSWLARRGTAWITLAQRSIFPVEPMPKQPAAARACLKNGNQERIFRQFKEPEGGATAIDV